LFDVEFMMID